MKRNLVCLVCTVILSMVCGSASVKVVAGLKDGGHPLPLCDPGEPCLNKALDTPMPVLADGTSPMPLCYPPNAACLIERKS